MAGYALWMYRGCKSALLCALLLLALPVWPADGDLMIESVYGSVQIRHGVEENWVRAAGGMVLRPEDSIRTGSESRVVLRHDDGTVYRIPEETIVDGTDFREMDRDELLLRLAMEDMLSVPDRIDDEWPIPRTTVLHGSPRGRTGNGSFEADVALAEYRINGARYLIGQNYSGSAILKIRQTLRIYPEGEFRIGAMLLAGESLERMSLYEEAARYYRTALDEGAEGGMRRSAEGGLQRLTERE
jgi:hypothetical protein